MSIYTDAPCLDCDGPVLIGGLRCSSCVKKRERHPQPWVAQLVSETFPPPSTARKFDWARFDKRFGPPDLGPRRDIHRILQGTRRRGSKYLCPFHSEETPSLNVFMGRDGKQRAHCFGCGWSGDCFDLERDLARRVSS